MRKGGIVLKKEGESTKEKAERRLISGWNWRGKVV